MSTCLCRLPKDTCCYAEKYGFEDDDGSLNINFLSMLVCFFETRHFKLEKFSRILYIVRLFYALTTLYSWLYE